MPFADIARPSIGVSLLHAAAKQRGYRSAVEYPNLRFADLIGRDVYRTISSGLRPQYLVGEWMFADDAFGAGAPRSDRFLEQVLQRHVAPKVVERIVEARARRAGYIDACVDSIMARAPHVVGFTTTFHQTCASLAVARRLKQQPQPPLVVFGGANCEGEMGHQLLESFPWIDVVSTGEADRSFPRLLDAVLADEPPAPIPGMAVRGQSAPDQQGEPLLDLDELPVPDYDDYFRQLDATAGGRDANVRVLVETSRGCWWGAKHHCTFCGLNGSTMAFRSKSPRRAFEEISLLAKRYDTRLVEGVDNILDLRYLDTLFPLLAESELELQFFYEVKANLRHDQLRTMAASGIRTVQPGIESLSTQVLRLMDKGVSALQNVQLLRWCEELDIVPLWNILAGFPGEDAAEYERMAELLPLLTHLRPPMSAAQVRLDRFSPFHTRSDHYGFRDVRPAGAYQLVFPLERDALSRLAYYFDYDYADGRSPGTYLEVLRGSLERWRVAWTDGGERPRLDADQYADGRVEITDTRPVATAGRHTLEGLVADVYSRCDAATTLQALLREAPLAGRAGELLAALDALRGDRLLIADGNRYLSLAVFRRRAQQHEVPTHTTTPDPLSVGG